MTPKGSRTVLRGTGFREGSCLLDYGKGSNLHTLPDEIKYQEKRLETIKNARKALEEEALQEKYALKKQEESLKKEKQKTEKESKNTDQNNSSPSTS